MLSFFQQRKSTLLFLTLLSFTSHVRADEKRYWINNSDSDWTISPRMRGTYNLDNSIAKHRKSNQEIGNMWFRSNGQHLGKIGESGSEIINLPRHSAVEVEFTHTNAAFRHYIVLKAGDGQSFIDIAADHAMLSLDLARKPVELQTDRYRIGEASSGTVNGAVLEDRALPPAERNKYIGGVILNSPNWGDLIITDQFKPKASPEIIR